MSYPVVRNLYFVQDSPKAGQLLLNEAMEGLKGRGRLALVPVWILNTRWNGQIFTFMMNGQTGEFIGDLPMDKAAYWKWTIGSGLGAAAAAVGVSALIWQLVLLTLR